MTRKRKAYIQVCIDRLSRQLLREARMMAGDFKGGLSVAGVANKYVMSRGVVEQAIRVVMKGGNGAGRKGA